MSVKFCKENLGKNIYTRLKKEIKLPLKYIMFVANYITNGFNGTQAYLRSVARKGTKVETAAAEAVRILGNQKVKIAIQIVFDAWLGEKKLKLEREIINRLYAKAFYDPFMFINPNGTPRFEDEEDIPEEWRCCVEGIEVKYYGKDADRRVITIKLADQNKAMKELSQYIELYKGNNTSELTMSNETVKQLSTIFGDKKK